MSTLLKVGVGAIATLGALSLFSGNAEADNNEQTLASGGGGGGSDYSAFAPLLEAFTKPQAPNDKKQDSSPYTMPYSEPASDEIVETAPNFFSVKRGGQTAGGYDFTSKQSVTQERALATEKNANNPIVQAVRSSGGGSSSKKEDATSSSSGGSRSRTASSFAQAVSMSKSSSTGIVRTSSGGALDFKAKQSITKKEADKRESFRSSSIGRLIG